MENTSLLFIVLSAMFVNNYVLQRFLGICSFLGVSKKLDQATGMSLAVILVMVVSTAVTWPIQHYLLNPFGMDFLQTLIFILVIAALVQFIEFAMKKYLVGLYNSLGIYLPLITTNCAVLGVTVLNIDEGYTFMQSIANAFGSGMGYFLAMVIFSGVRLRTENCDTSENFKGLPITLVSAAILAAAFNGFAGVIQTLFGV